MPKLIPELRQRFMNAAKARMLEGENREITIRQIAFDCQTAIGTVYNYFPSKRALILAVMQADWDGCMAQIEEISARAPNPLAGLEAICAILWKYTQRYFPFWEQYDKSITRPSLHLYHDQIISQIIPPIAALLERFQVLFDPYLPTLLADLLLIACRSEDGFLRAKPCLKKLLS